MFTIPTLPLLQCFTLAHKEDLERFGLHDAKIVFKDDDGVMQMVKLEPRKNTHFRTFLDGSIEFVALYGDCISIVEECGRLWPDSAIFPEMKARYLLYSLCPYNIICICVCVICVGKNYFYNE